MANLGEVVARVADMLARNDLNNQIRAEILRAIERFETQPWAFTEVLNATLTTVVGQAWYPTVAASAGLSQATFPGDIAASRIVRVDWIGNPADDDWLIELDFATFQRWQETDGTLGDPYHWTRYAGRIGLYPTPDAVYSLSVSGLMRPPALTNDTETSIWFDRAGELIETRAAATVAAKFLADPERARMFAEIATGAEMALIAESGRERGTGKLKPCW